MVVGDAIPQSLTGVPGDAERGLKIVAICPFVEAFVHDHAEYADLAVADPARRPKTRA